MCSVSLKKDTGQVEDKRSGADDQYVTVMSHGLSGCQEVIIKEVGWGERLRYGKLQKS